MLLLIIQLNADGYVVHTASIGTAQESVLRLTTDGGVPLNDVLLGNATPDFNLGLNTTFRYKDLSSLHVMDTPERWF